jgi:hypothetical protein
MPETTGYVPREWRPLRHYAESLGCSVRHLQRQVEAGKLKAATIDDRGTKRTCDAFVDQWLMSTVEEKP